MKAQRELYAQALKDGDTSDVVADIQRRYFKRWPITLQHNQEQTQEWLDKVDDDAPDDELSEPDVDGMSPEDASKALSDFEALMEELKGRKDVRFFVSVVSSSS